MKNHKINLILLLAVIFGIAAALGVFQYLSAVKAAYVKQGNFVQVAVATQYVAPKTQLTMQMFTMRDIPSKYVNSDAVVDPAEINGKLTKAPIYRDEQILRSKVVGKDDRSGTLAFIVPAGKRAVTVAVNEVSGIAGMVMPGDIVDVLVTFDDNNENPMTSLILQNISVLATDQETDTGMVQSDQQKEAAKTVTLAVTPQQGQQLTLASEQGSIRLMMRSPADQKVVKIPSAKLPELVR